MGRGKDVRVLFLEGADENSEGHGVVLDLGRIEGNGVVGVHGLHYRPNVPFLLEKTKG